MTNFEIFELVVRFFAVLFGMSLNMRRIMKSGGKTVDDILFITSIVLGIALGFIWRTYEK